MNNLTKLIQEQWMKTEASETMSRILVAEQSFINHGGESYRGRTLEELFNSNTTELLEGVKKMLEEMKIVEFAYFGCNCCEHKMSCNPPQPNGGHNSALATAISNIEETLNINK